MDIKLTNDFIYMWSIILNTAACAVCTSCIYSAVRDIMAGKPRYGRLMRSDFMNYGLLIGGVIGFIKGYTGKPVIDLIFS